MGFAVTSPAAVFAQDSSFLLCDDKRALELNNYVRGSDRKIGKFLQLLFNGVHLAISVDGRTTVATLDHLKALSLIFPDSRVSAKRQRTNHGSES